ncbi:tRNA lysidine(34) synthetase TilS [Dongia deserti]|uniref:tRNA lysidine(34) synthetase TilS n=1 Tax=Dongia deserti TaxID=2268030 RepID=UPI000E6507BD|nr:tRNA lysidine(34) synthetase TilS [Dongia deserti]
MPDIDIASLMAPLGPFERAPTIAVAVSGGSDSLGLGLLLADWVKERGGRLAVLSVDHGLRPESAGECARVAEIFAAVPNCSAHVLRWEGDKPAHGLQAAARAARHGLLTDWCRAGGALHLAIAHTAEDQAETVAMRRNHGSGRRGLAGMAAVRPENGVRLLRPLLPVSRAAIRDWLRAKGQGWIEDPSNALTKFERVRVRQRLASDEAAALLEEARQSGKTRDRLERAAARLLAEAGEVKEVGYVSIGLRPLLDATPDVRETALWQMILAVSGANYTPDLEDLLVALEAGGVPKTVTLGGCLVQGLRERLYIFREAAGIGGPVPVSAGWVGCWDRRFGLEVAGSLPPGLGWAIGHLGEQGLRQAVERFGTRLKRHPIPLPARLALPALWQGEHLVCQPHLHLGEGLAARPRPRHTVTTCGFTVAAGRPHTIYSSTLC